MMKIHQFLSHPRLSCDESAGRRGEWTSQGTLGARACLATSHDACGVPRRSARLGMTSGEAVRSRNPHAAPARASFSSSSSLGKPPAQNIILKTGQTIETKGIRRSGDMMMIKVQVGASSGEVGYHASTIAKIAFPEPPQLKTTAIFLVQAQPEKALADIEPIVRYYEMFRDIPGNWWAPAALLKVSALSGMQLDKEAERLGDEIRKNVIDPETARAAQLQLVGGLVRRDEYDKALQLCDTVIKESRKAEVLAEAWVHKGDVFLAQRQWDDAALAYLHVTVFYEDAKFWMPRALLGSAPRFPRSGKLGRSEAITQRSDHRIPQIGAGRGRPGRATESCQNEEHNGTDHSPEENEARPSPGSPARSRAPFSSSLHARLCASDRPVWASRRRAIKNALGTDQGRRLGHVPDRALLDRDSLPDRRRNYPDEPQKSRAVRAGGSTQDALPAGRLRRRASLLQSKSVAPNECLANRRSACSEKANMSPKKA